MPTAAPDASSRPSLRERRREELLAQVRQVARSHLATQGAAALSLRAVARDVGIAVSALYRYYASRDDLITELLVDAFDAQADAVEAAVTAARQEHPGDPGAALRAGFTAYRAWSVDNPADFGLCYGTPVPAYAAPADRTVRAGTRAVDLLLGIVAEAVDADRLDPAAAARRAATLTPATAQQLEALRERRGYPLPVPVLAAVLDAFIHLHGLVVMEVFGQLRPITAEPAALFAETLEDCLGRAGLG